MSAPAPGGACRPLPGNERESPLSWLRSRKDRNGRRLIDEAQFEAGERLRADYEFAQFRPRITAGWSCPQSQTRARRGASGSPAELNDAVLDAKARVRRALAAVGPEISGVLIDICCELKGIEEAEKENGWPQRAGKVVLQIALTRLAKHYGLIADSCRPRRDTEHRPKINGVSARETLEAQT